jgi:non-heme chloroperoxidase
MEKLIASLRVEVSEPERNKFTAPFLLLHGLWTGSWMWREVAGALSQRGWECWAPDLRGRPGSRTAEAIGRVSLQDYVEDVVTVARHLWAPPIVWGHDLGALLALCTAAEIKSRALICLAPLLPHSWVRDGRPPAPLVRLAAVPALLWSRPLPPPPFGMARDFLFLTLPPSVQASLHARLQPDSGMVARALTRSQVPLPTESISCPVLIVSGGADHMSSPPMVRWLTERLGAEHYHYPEHGHWPLAGERWAKLVGALHRWLITTQGEALLVPQESEE